MNKLLQETETRINGILQNRDEKIVTLQAKLEKAREALQAAEKEAAASTEAEDVKAYQKAKADRADAAAAAELFERRISDLKDKPLISKGEYEKTVADLMNAITTEDNAAREKIAASINTIQQLGNELNASIKYGNELLHQLQHDVFKDPAEMICANGNAVHISSLEKEYKDFAAVRLAIYIAEGKNRI